MYSVQYNVHELGAEAVIHVADSVRRARPLFLGLAATLAVLASGVWPAGASSAADGTNMSLGFTSRSTTTPTGVNLAIDYAQPGDASAKPPAVTSITIDLPAATAVNVGAVAVCKAPDPVIEALGDSACPPASQVGAGTVTVVTGFGPPIDPVLGHVEIFNDGTGFVEVITLPGLSLPALDDRVTVAGDTLSAQVPTIPGGPPDLHTAVKDVVFSFPAASGYFTTPATCPVGEEWTSRARFGFADGTTQEATSVTPCSGGA